MIALLKRSDDFERVLRTRSRVSSAHFALHHLEWPSAELSTDDSSSTSPLVDDSPRQAEKPVWLGTVVPKRHARRSVTRTLLKRQIRAVVGERERMLAAGIWVVRLRAPFDKAAYPSAASEPLRRAARTELQQLLIRAVAA